MKRERVILGGKVHLHRWVLFRCRRFQIVLHKFMCSDPLDLHDHPWWNISIVLWGKLLEEIPEGTRDLRCGDVVYRHATDLHRLRVVHPAWTLFITGPEEREWGYLTLNGWIHWKKYRSPRIV